MDKTEAKKMATQLSELQDNADEIEDEAGPDQAAALRLQAADLESKIKEAGFDVLELLSEDL